MGRLPLVDLLKLVEDLKSKGDLDEAYARVVKALPEFPASGLLRLALSGLEQHRGNDQAAAAALQAAIALSPALARPTLEGPAFRPGLSPLELEGRRKTAFFHHPHWKDRSWQDVVVAYARAFAPDEDVTLVLWLDPAQGLAPEAAEVLLLDALAAAGLPAHHDYLLLPDDLDEKDLARLYSSVDVVVPAGDPLQARRAQLVGCRTLLELSPAAWRREA